jgi:uncharacterized protein (TIGR02588 family)
MASKTPASRKPADTSPLEWVVAGIGALLLLASAGYMIWYGVTASDKPPEVTAKALERTHFGGTLLVHVKVHNRGGSAAANVQLAGQLTGKDGSPQSSRVVIDYVPQNAERDAYLQFAEPEGGQAGKLVLRVEGMTKP